ncbi:MAG: VOC family protein [Clostridiales bacterium]|nr:VOC family protein [Clostridiales bacterium]
MKIKSLHHVCIQTDRYKESIEFYTKILGFKLFKESENFHTRKYNSWLSFDGFMIELQTEKEGESLIPWNSNSCGPVHLSFLVEDIDEFYRSVKAKGQKKFKKKNGDEIYKVEKGYLFKMIAPEGTEIEIRDQIEL